MFQMTIQRQIIGIAVKHFFCQVLVDKLSLILLIHFFVMSSCLLTFHYFFSSLKISVGYFSAISLYRCQSHFYGPDDFF